jgi:hypothetical protein
MSNRDATCAERVAEHLAGRLSDLRKLGGLYCEGDEEGDYDLGTFPEYGLYFDYVAPGTFADQKEGYYRYQISWGGTSDEFRFFADRNHRGLVVYRIEYWFLDWFDGAHIQLTGEDCLFMEEIFQFFEDIGSCEAEYEKTMED